MGWLQRRREKRLFAKFDRIGAGCRIAGEPPEIKGHVELGDNVLLCGNIVLRTHKGGRILIGNAAEIGDYVLIQCNSRVEIGAEAYIGGHCVLRDTNHVMWGTDAPWRLTPHLTQPIVIGPRSFLGAHCYVMPGVTIGEGAAIVPGSVVGKDVPPFEIWAGMPARFVAHRTELEKRTSLGRVLQMASLFGVPQDATTDE